MAFRDVISYAFTEGETVAAAVSDLCPLLAITIILNGIQPVLSGKIDESNWIFLFIIIIFYYWVTYFSF